MAHEKQKTIHSEQNGKRKESRQRFKQSVKTETEKK